MATSLFARRQYIQIYLLSWLTNEYFELMGTSPKGGPAATAMPINIIRHKDPI
jgi:hypothetical protein